MTISPWAILMTPMTPKVTASPIAASSKTEPRLDSEDQIFGKAKQRKPVVDPVNRLLHLSTNFGIRFHECAISRFQQSSFQQGFDFRVIAIGETTDRGAAQRRDPANPARESRYRFPERARISSSVSRSRALFSSARESSVGREITFSTAARRSSRSELDSASWPSTPRISPRSLLLATIFLISRLVTLPDRDTRCGIGQSINLSIAIRDHHDIVGFATIQTSLRTRPPAP